MAIYHLHTQVIGRSSGKSAVASAAYRSGEKMYDEHTGLAFDYTRKQNIDHTEIIAPDHAPAWVQDRETLWNQVEQVERRKDAQLARELNIALPKELSKEQQIELVRDFSKEQFVAKGMAADIACHNLDGENPHAHIMLTTREITSEGFGNKNRDWNDRELHNGWRKAWADQANKALEKAGSQERIDHRSLQDQGIDRLPQIHVGPHALGMEKKKKNINFKSDRGEQNRKIIDFNEARKRHSKQVAEFKRDAQQFKKDLEQLKAQKKAQQPKQTTPISAPARQPQPKTLEPVRKEVGNSRNTLSVNEWKNEISQARQVTVQPQSSKSSQEKAAKAEYNQAYEDMSIQRQIVSNLKQELNSVISRLNEYRQLDSDIDKLNKKIGNINLFDRLNPLKRKEIKALEKQRDLLNTRKQISFGNTSWDDLADKINKLSRSLEPEKKKLAVLENKHDQAKKAFDQVNTKTYGPKEISVTKNQAVQKTGHPVNDALNAFGNSFKQVKRKEEFAADKEKAKLENKMQQRPQRSRNKVQEDDLEL